MLKIICIQMRNILKLRLKKPGQRRVPKEHLINGNTSD